jgi:choline dehydrogenase-like flavoprotein
MIIARTPWRFSFRYRDLEPYYDQAETWFGVHGDDGDDPTAPRGRKAYPFPPVPSAPIIARMAENLRKQGLHPSALPLAIDSGPTGTCILCKTCDGFYVATNARKALLSDLRSEHRTKPVPPETDGLMAENDSAFGQQIFDIPQRQRILHVHHHHQSDHRWRVVEISEWVFHDSNYHAEIGPEV